MKNIINIGILSYTFNNYIYFKLLATIPISSGINSYNYDNYLVLMILIMKLYNSKLYLSYIFLIEF